MAKRWYEQMSDADHDRIERILEEEDSNGSISIHHKSGVIMGIHQDLKWQTTNGSARVRTPRTSSVPTR